MQTDIAISSDDFNYGQPSRAKNTGRKKFAEYYKMGRTIAEVEQKKKETEQMSLMNMIQVQQLNQTKNDLLDVLAEVKRTMPPPMGGAMPGGLPMLGGAMPPGGGPPPLGMPPPEAAGMMPPEMGAAGPPPIQIQ
jgi:hypothetical protein